MSRVLVTGAGGFIGRQLLPLLTQSGQEVHAVSTEARASSSDGVSWHRADLLEPDAARELVRAAEPTHLLHLAWYTKHGAFWNALDNVPWVEASVRLWSEFAAAGGRRAVAVGSCAEYEWSEPVLSERSTPLRPASLYGVCKDAVRRVLEAASPAAGVSFAWGRVFFIYGPEESSGRLVPSVAEALVEGRAAQCSTGEQVRDFMHVADAAGALTALLDSDVRGAVNIGSGNGLRVREIVELIGELTGRPELIEFGTVSQPAEDPPSIVADTSRLRNELGWSPSITLEQGLAGTIEALRTSGVGSP